MEPLKFHVDQSITINDVNDKFKKIITRIPTNVFIHKTITGIGATTTEIEDERHSILILPNVATIISKRDKHIGSFALYEGVSLSDLTEYLNDTTIVYQKLLTTPESLFKIINVCKSLGINAYSKFFLLLDEAHKLSQDVGYRPNITLAMEHFFKFRLKAMISATPLGLSDPRFNLEGFKTIKLEPAFAFKKPIELLFHNNHIQALGQVFERNTEAKQCIFFNSINGIRDILKKLTDFNLIPNSSIFCSKESAQYLNNLEVDGQRIYKAFSAFRPEYMSHYNFFTSSFYNGLDIELEEFPQVILITERNDPKTYFDPFTDTIQVLGRFRRKKGSDITETFIDEAIHLVNNGAIRESKTREDVIRWLDAERNVYDSIYTLYKSNPNYLERNIYHESLKRLLFHKYLVDDRHLRYNYPSGNIDDCSNEDKGYMIDHYKVDHLFETERVKSYYSNPEELWLAYVESGYNPKSKYENRSFEVYLNSVKFDEGNVTTPLYKLNLRGGKRYSKENIKRILNFLLSAENISGTAQYDKIVFRVTDPYTLVRRAYDKLGCDRIEKLGYSITKIRQALIDYDFKAGKNKEPVIDSVYQKFPLNIRLKQSYIKKELQLIYDHYNLTVKAKSTDLRQWYELKEVKLVVIEKAPLNNGEKGFSKQRVEHRAFILLSQKYNVHRMLMRT